MYYRTLAYKLDYVPGDPAASDPAAREGSWHQTRSFRCKVEPLTAPQIVRAGRDSAEKQIRLYYRPLGVQLDNSDRVQVNGKIWSIIYADPVYSKLQAVFVECKEVG